MFHFKMEISEKEDITDIMNLLEAEPENDSSNREQLAVLVASGQSKEMIGVYLTQDQVKRLSEKDVEKYFKRYEASLSSKTCNAMVDTFIQLSCKALSHFLPLDKDKLLNDLNENFMVKRELSMIAGRLSLNYGKYMAAISAALLTAKNLNLEKRDEEPEKELKKELDNNLIIT